MIKNPISYLPHGPEIVAIKEILSLGQNSICCSIFCCSVLAKGSIINSIEYVAQATAVGRISNAKQPELKLGMIIRIKEFEILNANEICQTVESSWSDSVANVYQTEGKAFSKDGKLLARVVMTMMEHQ